ncbi:hypothetical protein B0H10DRAFT_1963850 [Mycena sp. CBHHK59/15]|nr:hypothetical protein B0H10DRAFT_1963850 [Mycena sp. CBHHK59/15]
MHRVASSRTDLKTEMERIASIARCGQRTGGGKSRSTQELLPIGSTLCPIIISSGKTQLTRFSGDQQAWPVYLTMGNIDKETRRTPSSRATVLLGYIPVTKLEIFTKANRSAVTHQLFHDCMRVMLESLKTAGKDGVRMECADGFVRMMYPILSAYIADYPEQCLIERRDLGNFPMRDPVETLHVLSEQSKGAHPPEFKTQNLRPINPFWADFPHCDIFSCITPDLLHELHNGVFGDHIVSWSSAAMSGEGLEIDRRFREMTPHPTLRHFKKGISPTTQWTGAEHKNMEKVFLGVLANATEPGVQRAIRGVNDFIYYAHFETHCDESLAKMDEAWAYFHANKEVFKELQICDHFDINKIHKIKQVDDAKVIIYMVKLCIWREPLVVEYLRFVDAQMAMFKQHQRGPTPSSRIKSGVAGSSKAPCGLPKSLYNREWLKAKSPAYLKQLKISKEAFGLLSAATGRMEL